MKPKIENVWLRAIGADLEIQADWSNERHHAVKIRHPATKDEVVEALLIMARIIGADHNLNGGQTDEH